MYKVSVLEDFYKKSKNTEKDVAANLEKYKLFAYKRFGDEITKVTKKATTNEELAMAREMVNTLESQYKIYPLTKDVITSQVAKHRKNIEKAQKKIKN